MSIFVYFMSVDGFTTFFWFIYAYYNLANEVSDVWKDYERFMSWLYDFFLRKEIIPIWISEENFQFLKEQYGEFQTQEEWVEYCGVRGSFVAEIEKEDNYYNYAIASKIVKTYFSKYNV